MNSNPADDLREGRLKKDGRGSQVRILHNTRCCIGGMVFHEVTVRILMGRRNTVMMPKSEHPLLDGFGWLRGYGQVFAANLF